MALSISLRHAAYPVLRRQARSATEVR